MGWVAQRLLHDTFQQTFAAAREEDDDEVEYVDTRSCPWNIELTDLTRTERERERWHNPLLRAYDKTTREWKKVSSIDEEAKKRNA